MSAVGGSTPYTYRIIAGPSTAPAQSSNVFPSLAPGTYFVDASSLSAGATGTYTLSINVLPAITTITPPFGAQGSAVNTTLSGNRFAAPATVDAAEIRLAE